MPTAAIDNLKGLLETTHSYRDVARFVGEAQPVSEDDVADAFGEIVNVLGGNIKALLPEHVGLTLPEVSRVRPSGQAADACGEALFAWRGRPLVISLYTI